MTYRLPPHPAEWIDRDRAVRFAFEGQSYTGFAGDTLTSALCANGVRMLGRSFKYHRARGVYSLANHDVNAMMENGQRTNIRGDVTPVYEGAEFSAVNSFGGLRRDRARFVDAFGAFLPVGFYYKTFHRPKSWFPFFERRMRAMAGLGAINAGLPRRRTPKAYDFCDVLIVGAGPSGLAAAVAAGETGAAVVVVDENARAGGSLNYQWAEPHGDSQHGDSRYGGGAAFRSLLDRAAALPNLQIRTSTLAAGHYADHWVALVDEQRLVKMRARSVVLATGCCEQPAVFGNNDLPGVMLASAAQRLVHQYSVKPFDRALVLAANGDGYRAALDLVYAGVAVVAIVDLRPEGESGPLGEQVRQASIRVYAGHAVCQAVAGPGKASIRGALVAPLDRLGQPERAKSFSLDADGLAMSVGWAPADGLFHQAGGRMEWSEGLQQFVPKSAPPGLFAAGRVNGVYALDDQLADGRRAGRAACDYLGFAGVQSLASQASTEHGSTEQELPAAPRRPTAPPSHPYPVFADAHAKCFVDIDEDVQYKDFVNAAQEGFDQVELMKRYSTYGMGPTQGKIANTNAIRILAKIKGQSVGQTGTTTARPFYHPVTLAHLAGRGFHPRRQTPLHARHTAAGAVFMPAGEWERPAYYAVAGRSRAAAIAEEVVAVRTGVGMIDVGTLGKIEVNGPGAGDFIDRMYTGRFANMAVGTTRYGLMCDESGVIADDGIVCRLAEDRYYLTTTTTASSGVYREMQRWAIIWRSDVVLVNATGAYGAINLAGPRSRRVLRQLSDTDLSSTAFPYLGVREGTIAGAPARFIRVGFVGEWSYEIHVPACSARRVWDELIRAGSADQVRPFGVEAQRVLRLEKGHVIVSQDTDGLTTPPEANMQWAVKTDKPFFVGQRSLAITGRKPLGRKLVGIALAGSPTANAAVKECHLIIDGGAIIGRITSISPSPTLRQTIGMAFVVPQMAAPGTALAIRVDDGSMVAGVVAAMPFYDPKGLRQIEAADE
jgi:sarcosine oxidase, subunit alpha